MVGTGFRLPWDAFPAPLTTNPIPSRPPFSQEARDVLDEEINLLCSKGAVEAVASSPGFYGRIFVVPKSSGGFRPVLDLSALNKFLITKPFRMETPSSIRDSIRQGDWATTLDLRDAYFHVLIHPKDRKYLRFFWKNRIFQFKVLPFGLSLAPWVFTRITRELAITLRSKGIRIRMYLDDWMTLAASESLCGYHTQQVVSTASELGFTPHKEKSSPTPSQKFSFLGMTFDTASYTVSPTEDRLARFLSLRDNLLQSRSASARRLHSLLGQMESMAALLPLGHLHKREFQRQLSCRWNQARDSWDTQIPLQDWLADALTQWMDPAWLRSGIRISQAQPDVELYTDASSQGWGAHVADLTASGTWSPEERKLHINALEMEAVVLAIQAFVSFLAGKVVLLCTDNTTVASYISKQGGTHVHYLSKKAESLLLFCHHQQISLQARHVPGKLNIIADFLSRPHCILHTEWTLARKVLLPIWETWHKPMVDLFATKFNHRLDLYVSPLPDPEAWAVDALSFPWKGFQGYAFPPIPILGKVIRKARLDQAALILVCPLWPAQPWYPDLLQLTHSPPLALALGKKSLVQPRSGIPHGNPTALNLHAWLLCGAACAHEELQIE